MPGKSNKITVEISANSRRFQSGLGSAESRLARFSRRADRIGRGLTKAVTVPLLGLGVAAVKSADDVADAHDQIATSTGATGKHLRRLKGVFDRVAGSVPASMDKTAAAVSNLNTLTGASGKTLEKLSTAVLEASRMLGEDGATNAKAFGQALNQFNIPAAEGRQHLRALYAATQKYGVGLGEITTDLKDYGAILQNAGFTMDETADLFGQLEKSGLSVSRVMPGLNMAFRKWAEAGKDPQKMLTRTIAKMKEAESSTEALGIATDAFGAEGAQRLTTAVRKGAISLDGLGDALHRGQTNIIKTGKHTRTLSERFQTMKNKSELALAPLGNVLLPMVTKAIQKVVPWITKAARWFSGLSDNAKKWVLIGAGIVASIGPMLIVFGKLVTIGGRVVRFLKMARSAMIAMNAVMAANPIILVVAAIAALAAGLVIAYKKSETFRRIVNTAFRWVKRVVLGTIKAWGDSQLRLVSLVIRAAGWIVDKMLWMAEKVVGGAAKAFGWVPGIGGKLKDAKNAVEDFREGVSDKMDSAADSVDDFRGRFDRYLTNAANTAHRQGKKAGRGLAKGISDGTGRAKRATRNTMRGIHQVGANWTGTLRGPGRQVMGGLAGGINAGARKPWRATANVMRGTHTVAGNWKGSLFHVGDQIMRSFGGGIAKGRRRPADATRNTMRRVRTVARNWSGVLVGPGRSLMYGLRAGMNAAKWAAIQKAIDIANEILRTFNRMMGIFSPSRKFADAGRQMIAGLQVGLSDTRGVRFASARLAEAAIVGFGHPQLAAGATVAGRQAGGNTYKITVNAPVGASSADIGRALVRHIDAYERMGGKARAR